MRLNDDERSADLIAHEASRQPPAEVAVGDRERSVGKSPHPAA